MKGQTFSLENKGETVTVSWKQDSILGIGGDRSQNYVLCEYKTSGGQPIPVYVQGGYTIKSELTVDSSLQYGMHDGLIFFVYHDKEQRPFQHRFVTNGLQKFAYAANEILKMAKGVDISWVAGDYLHDL